jgi:hypothetical protein
MENLGAIQFEYISTEKMVVDMLTKAIPREKHSWCMKILGLESLKANFNHLVGVLKMK